MTEWTDDRLAALPVRGGLRQRGLEMTRMETFCDAAFAASFAAIAGFWLGHRAWSSNYGLDDALATILSLMMVFVMLVYVYPLKMMFSAFASFASGGWLPASFVITRRSDLLGLFVI